MENKVCCCFGHRDIFGSAPKLIDVLENLICNENVSVFMTGGMGDFDSMFTSAVQTLKRKYPDIKLFLIRPYFSNSFNINKKYYEYIYDQIIVPDTVTGVHPKAAIAKRNRWMVEESDCIVTFVRRNFGGAYEAKKYAIRLNKPVYELSE